jgi:hypothetical protein
MNWNESDIDMYTQAALNMMPITKSMDTSKEPFYDILIDNLTHIPSVVNTNNMPSDAPIIHRLPNDIFANCNIHANSVAECNVAMYSNTDDNNLRWTPAYLLCDEVRPRNLTVISDATVSKVIWKEDLSSDDSSNSSEKYDTISASGVLLTKSISGTSNASENISKTEHEIYLEENGDLIIAAGALGTPALLQRSGVGNKKHLQDLGVSVVIENDNVGHGVDHIEVPMLYEWILKDLPNGGPMGWPLVLFADIKHLQDEDKVERQRFIQAHVGTGHAEPYTSTPSLVMTPNCTQPNMKEGYHVQIKSTDPNDSLRLIYHNLHTDILNLISGVIKVDSIVKSSLQGNHLVGVRLSPPIDINIGKDMNQSDMLNLYNWIKRNHGTAFHWSCTCRSGLTNNSTSADSTLLDDFVTNNKFHLLGNKYHSRRYPIRNVYIGKCC